MIEDTDRAAALVAALDDSQAWAPHTTCVDLLEHRDRALRGALPVLLDLARAVKTADGDDALAREMLRGVRVCVDAARRDLAYVEVLLERDPAHAARLRRTHARTRSAARLVAFWEEIGGDELPLEEGRSR